MGNLRVLSAAEQVAVHLRGELLGGRWGGRMPGGDTLAADLGVGRNTVESALQILEEQGLLIPQGPGRRRRVEIPAHPKVVPGLRVAILPGDSADRRLDYLIELIYELEAAGHKAFYTERSMVELGMNLSSITRMVKKTEADAWIVVAGSREVLEWFSEWKTPAFALFGRRRGLPLAGVGPDKATAYTLATRRLLELGHRRIVLMARTRRRVPVAGASEQAFLDALTAYGISPSAFHLPDWEETINGFHACLESLFKISPPSALIIDEAPFYVAAQQFLGNRKLRVPEDVSLVCTDEDPAFAWCKPSVTHIRWDSGPLVRRIARWVTGVSRGKEDRLQMLTPAEFVEGGTIGSVKAR